MKCCDLRPGLLRTPVTFQRKTRTADGAGGFTETWATLRNARAHVVALSGFERLTADRVNAETKERIVCRYFAGLLPEDRVVIEGKAHNITFINDMERRKRWYQLDISGGVAT